MSYLNKESSHIFSIADLTKENQDEPEKILLAKEKQENEKNVKYLAKCKHLFIASFISFNFLVLPQCFSLIQIKINCGKKKCF